MMISIVLTLLSITGVQSFAPYSTNTPSSKYPERNVRSNFGSASSSSSSSSQLRLSKDPKQETETFQEKLDRILDTQFFDPSEVFESESSEIKENPEKSLNPLVWFANLVQNDYETAEALFAAGLISFMVVLSQELLRMVRYGDAYHPFQNGGGGSLF